MLLANSMYRGGYGYSVLYLLNNANGPLVMKLLKILIRRKISLLTLQLGLAQQVLQRRFQM